MPSRNEENRTPQRRTRFHNDDPRSSSRGPTGRSRRGFASMDEATQREIASRGGRAAHERGTAHEFDSEEAREAGRRGGRVVSQNREHMAEIGREGGRSRWRNYNEEEERRSTRNSRDLPEEARSSEADDYNRVRGRDSREGEEEEDRRRGPRDDDDDYRRVG